MTVVPSRLNRYSRYAGMAVGVVLIGFVGFLVVSQYRARLALEKSQLRQRSHEVGNRATAIGYFLSERDDDLHYLSESRELSIYFENLALGMSMEYGLRASLWAIEDLFDRTRLKKKLGDEAIYSRIVFVDAEGRVLVDSGAPSPGQRPDISAFAGPGETRRLECDRRGASPQVVVSLPYEFKGQTTGRILAWIPLPLVFSHFVGRSEEAPAAITFRSEYAFVPPGVREGLPMRFRSLPPAGDATVDAPTTAPGGSERELFAVRAPIPDTPLALVAFVPAALPYGLSSPRAVLLTSGSVAVVLLAGLFAVVVLDRRNSTLATRLEETSLRERAVDEKNQELQQEIADRRLAQQRLALFRQVFLESNEAVAVFSPDGAFQDQNAEYERLTGYAAVDTAGKRIDAVVGVETARAILSALEREGRFFLERPCQTRSGEELSLELSGFALRTEAGDITSFVCQKRDITLRKQVEREMRDAREAAESASRAKSEFLANMSHEIRTPMNGILGMTELALDTELSVEQRDYILAVKVSAENLLDVINDVLDFSKVEAGKTEIEAVPFSLRNTVGQTLKVLGSRAFQKGLELTYDIEAKAPDHVVGDPGKLRQVLINLVGNAVKFTPKGEVSVSVSADEDGSGARRLSFAVTDTGIGIPAGKLDRIFEPFTQADGSTTRQFGGTGLGLTISQRMVQLMGGTITVESVEGKGSIFRFSVPLRALAPEPAVNEASRLALDGKNVLVVDDNGINRSLLRHLLRKWGMRVVEAESARVALAWIEGARERDERFDLLLVDVHMPLTDGWMLAEKIRTMGPPSEYPIIMMPSASARGDADRCRTLKIDGYLAKPVVQDELEAAMATVLGGSPPPPDFASVAAHKLGTRSGRSLSILLAEDVDVNQKVVCKILERHGHRVVVASNGREAVEAWEREAFDLVFMDIQMPEMDGFQATAAIRAREEGKARTPIVAMTAYAMTGDAEKCLAAGMDAYVSKPVKGEQIIAVLEEFFRGVDGSRTAAPQTSSSRLRSPVDWKGLLTMLDGDREFARGLLETFLEHLPDQREPLEAAVDSGDAQSMSRAAHKLKGSLQSIRARDAAESALALETQGRDGTIGPACAAWERLRRQLEEVEAHIQGILGGETV